MPAEVTASETSRLRYGNHANQYPLVVRFSTCTIVSSDESYLTAKERVSYESFFYGAFCTLYAFFFTTSTLVNVIVAASILGSLFVRWQLVYSDETIETSRLGRLTGSIMLAAAVAILSHILLQLFIEGVDTIGISAGGATVLFLLGLSVCGIVLTLHQPLFRSDKQNRRTFEANAEKDGVQGIIARAGLHLHREADRGNFDADPPEVFGREEIETIQRMQREGTIRTEEADRVKEAYKDMKALNAISLRLLHAVLSVVVLVGGIVLLGVTTPAVSTDALSVVLVVSGIYYSVTLLNVQFGLRKTIQRSFWMMPAELIFCILVANVSLYNSGLIGGAEAIAIVPFTLYVLTPYGYKVSQRLWIWIGSRIGETSDELEEFAQEMEKKSS